MLSQKVEKIFQKEFAYPIWRVEIDEKNHLLAVETRDPASTWPYFSMFRFNGQVVLSDLKGIEKEWTLASIIDEHIVLKKISTSSPVVPGVSLFSAAHPDQWHHYPNHHFLDRYKQGVLLRSSLFTDGFEQVLDVNTQTLTSASVTPVKPYPNTLVYPFVYNGKRPSFLNQFDIDGELWIDRIDEYFLWIFYEQMNSDTYQLHVVRSDRNRVIDEIKPVKNLRLKLNPALLRVDNQIFLLTDNKREFVSYLV